MKYILICLLACSSIGITAAQTERSKQKRKSDKSKADSWRDSVVNPHNLTDTASLKDSDWDRKHTRKWMDSTRTFDTSRR